MAHKEQGGSNEAYADALTHQTPRNSFPRPNMTTQKDNQTAQKDISNLTWMAFLTLKIVATMLDKLWTFDGGGGADYGGSFCWQTIDLKGKRRSPEITTPFHRIPTR